MQIHTKETSEEDKVLQFNILNSLVIFNGNGLSPEVLENMYNYGAYPIMIEKGNESSMAKFLRPFLPEHIKTIDYVIVAVQYDKEFLA